MHKWDELPDNMKIPEVIEYYNILKKRQTYLIVRRIFDIIFSFIMIIILLIPMIIIGLSIKLNDSGPIFFKQKRITTYGKEFTIYKFRTMAENDKSNNSNITIDNDSRITSIGVVLRKYKLDELPQLFNIFIGDMGLIGTRPEVADYVKKYKPEYYATLLIPAGITSSASIKFADESKLIKKGDDVDEVYLNIILPSKMILNLEDIKNIGVVRDLKILFRTVVSVFLNNK